MGRKCSTLRVIFTQIDAFRILEFGSEIHYTHLFKHHLSLVCVCIVMHTIQFFCYKERVLSFVILFKPIRDELPKFKVLIHRASTK